MGVVVTQFGSYLGCEGQMPTAPDQGGGVWMGAANYWEVCCTLSFEAACTPFSPPPTHTHTHAHAHAHAHIAGIAAVQKCSCFMFQYRSRIAPCMHGVLHPPFTHTYPALLCLCLPAGTSLCCCQCVTVRTSAWQQAAPLLPSTHLTD
jgi:hypothetical protein